MSKEMLRRYFTALNVGPMANVLSSFTSNARYVSLFGGTAYTNEAIWQALQKWDWLMDHRVFRVLADFLEEPTRVGEVEGTHSCWVAVMNISGRYKQGAARLKGRVGEVPCSEDGYVAVPVRMTFWLDRRSRILRVEETLIEE
jgi:hypothetical protein